MQHFDEQPMKRKIKLGVTTAKINYRLLQHTAEINYFSLNVPVKAHTLHRDCADATLTCLVTTSCKLLIIRKEFASFRKGYCIPSPFQTFNSNPLPVTPPWIYCSTSFAFNPRPTINLRHSSFPPAWPFTEVRKEHSRGQSLGHRDRHCHSLPAKAAAGKAAHGWLMFSRHL